MTRDSVQDSVVFRSSAPELKFFSGRVTDIKNQRVLLQNTKQYEDNAGWCMKIETPSRSLVALSDVTAFAHPMEIYLSKQVPCHHSITGPAGLQNPGWHEYSTEFAEGSQCLCQFKQMHHDDCSGLLASTYRTKYNSVTVYMLETVHVRNLVHMLGVESRFTSAAGFALLQMGKACGLVPADADGAVADALFVPDKQMLSGYVLSQLDNNTPSASNMLCYTVSIVLGSWYWLSGDERLALPPPSLFNTALETWGPWEIFFSLRSNVRTDVPELHQSSATYTWIITHVLLCLFTGLSCHAAWGVAYLRMQHDSLWWMLVGTALVSLCVSLVMWTYSVLVLPLTALQAYQNRGPRPRSGNVGLVAGAAAPAARASRLYPQYFFNVWFMINHKATSVVAIWLMTIQLMESDCLGFVGQACSSLNLSAFVMFFNVGTIAACYWLALDLFLCVRGPRAARLPRFEKLITLLVVWFGVPVAWLAGALDMQSTARQWIAEYYFHGFLGHSGHLVLVVHYVVLVCVKVVELNQ